MHIILCSSSFLDERRLKTIINIAANNAAMGVPNAGHLLAIRSASSGLTPSASVSEIFSGLTQVCAYNVHTYIFSHSGLRSMVGDIL